MRNWNLIAVVALITGCGQGEVISSVAVRDSAGVRVVEQGTLDSLPVLTLASEPVYTVGWSEGGTAFGSVPVGVLLSDGSALVFDEDAMSFTRISPDGNDVRRVGRAGEGPGEFQDAASVTALRGDTVVVYDRALGRLSRLDEAGNFVSSALWSQEGMVFSRPAGVTASGGLAWIPSSFAVRRDQEGPTSVTGPLIRSGLLGEEADTVGVVTMLELDYEQGRPVNDPFMAFGVGAGYQGGFVWGWSEIAELRWLSEDGTVRQISRWSTDPTPVDDGVWARYEDAYRARMAARTTRPTEERIATQLRAARDAAPATLPFFTFSFATRDGEVWISDYLILGSLSDRYVRFGEDGVAFDTVVFPQGIRILDVRDGRVLGVMTDEWDVQAVVLFDGS